MLTYDNARSSRRATAAFDHLDENEDSLAYLPLAWVGDHFSPTRSPSRRLLRQLPGERPRPPWQDRREIGPTFSFAPPRISRTCSRA